MNLIVSIKVFPASGRVSWVFDKAGFIKCYLKSHPLGGAANKELIVLLSKTLGMHQKKITILRGHTVRLKKIMIEDSLSYERFLALLGLQQGEQRAIF